MNRRMRKQKKQGFLRQGLRKKLSLRGRQNYHLGALKLLLKCQSNPMIVTIQPLPSTQTKNFLNQASVTKHISDVLFEVEMQAKREEPVNCQMMYGSYGNNYYRNVYTTPLQGKILHGNVKQPFVEIFCYYYLYIKYNIIIA